MSTLYSDEHPDKSLKNTGYKNKSSAIETLRLIKLRSLHYQFTVINTMYYRAKNHKNKTKEMEEAMKVYKLWIDKYPEKKERETKKSKNFEIIFNTNFNDQFPSTAVDSSGNVYVAYQTDGTVSGGTNSGNFDIVVFKLDTNLLIRHLTEEVFNEST